MNIRLTQTVKKGGCAAKIAATTLREVLSSLSLPNKHPDLMISSDSFDDAAILKINDQLACVETLDFFTPIVDTPFKFGKIAAVNALSDVYAMGGTPKTCMAILAFPLMSLDLSVMQDVLAGACEAISQADALLVGGHSIDDDSLKFGLSVTGHVHPLKVWSNASAQVGDDLILTKGLGTGTLCAGLKNSVYTEEDISHAIESMMTLNRITDLLSQDSLSAIHAATDITGFGLLGHAMQMAQASHVCLEINASMLPILDLAIESLGNKNLTKAHRTNREYTHAHCKINQGLDENLQQLLFDPQTSGGLLIAVTSEQSQQFLQEIKGRFPLAKKIGRVAPSNQVEIYVS